MLENKVEELKQNFDIISNKSKLNEVETNLNLKINTAIELNI